MKSTRALISTFSLHEVIDIFDIENVITDNNFHLVLTRPATYAASFTVVKL